MAFPGGWRSIVSYVYGQTNRDGVRTGGEVSQDRADAGPCAKRPRLEVNGGSNGSQPVVDLGVLLSAADTVSVQGPGKCSKTGSAMTPLNQTPAATTATTAASANRSPMTTAIYILSDPSTTDTLKNVVESSLKGIHRSDLEAAAAATVPHLLAVPAAVARLSLRIPDFQNKVPYIQILQDAAAAYTADPGPGFCEHVQQAAAAAGGWLPDGAKDGCKNTSFDPRQSLSVDEAVVVLATLPKTVRASISRRYNIKHADSIPPVHGQAYKRVLWAVHRIPPCHDEIIKMLMHQSAKAPVISDVGMKLLRRLAAVISADPEAYAGDEAVISIEAI